MKPVLTVIKVSLQLIVLCYFVSMARPVPKSLHYEHSLVEVERHDPNLLGYLESNSDICLTHELVESVWKIVLILRGDPGQATPNPNLLAAAKSCLWRFANKVFKVSGTRVLASSLILLDRLRFRLLLMDRRKQHFQPPHICSDCGF
jgi:hypothetical protein